jgi:hypothetical protein
MFWPSLVHHQGVHICIKQPSSLLILSSVKQNCRKVVNMWLILVTELCAVIGAHSSGRVTSFVTIRLRVRSDASDLIYPPAVRHIHVKMQDLMYRNIIVILTNSVQILGDVVVVRNGVWYLASVNKKKT